MKTSDILKEKYRVQKQLADAAKNIHDYFAKTHESAQQIMHSLGMTKQPQEQSDNVSTK